MTRFALLPALALLVACPPKDTDTDPDTDPDTGVDTDTDTDTAADTTAPEAPGELAAAWDEDAVALSWSPPADADVTGYLVARGCGEYITATPGAGDAVGAVLADGSEIVYAGAATALDDAEAWPGLATYRVWAVDAAGNLGPASAQTHALIPIPAETFTLSGDFSTAGAYTVQASGPADPAIDLDAVSAGLRPAEAAAYPEAVGGLFFEAVEGGAAGNGIRVQIQPRADVSALEIAVTGTTVSARWPGRGLTSYDVAVALNAHPGAAALIRATGGSSHVPQSSVDLTLSGGSDSEVRIAVDVTNRTCRPLNQLYLSTPGTTQELAPNARSRRLGPHALAAGETRRAVIDVAAAGNASFSLDLQPLDAPAFITSGRWDDGLVVSDTAGRHRSQVTTSVDVAYRPFTGWDSHLRSGAIVDLGRAVLVGNHNVPTVVRIDLSTLVNEVALDLGDGSGVGHVDRVIVDPTDDTIAYAVVNHGVHTAAWREPGVRRVHIGRADTEVGSDCLGPEDEDTDTDTSDHCIASEERVELVKFDARTLTVLDRADLATGGATGVRGRGLSISADGRRLAVALQRHGEVALIDAATLDVLDRFDLDGTLDLLGATELPEGACPWVQETALSADGATLWAACGSTRADWLEFTLDGEDVLREIDTASGAITLRTPPTRSAANQPGFVSVGPDGRVWYGRKKELESEGGNLAVWDPAGASWTEVADIEQAYAIAFDPAGSAWVADCAAEENHRVDPATTAVDLTRTADIGSSGWGHLGLITPY